MPEIILPGTYITVRDEALISAGRVATGNIGIVGTASKGTPNEVFILSSFTEAAEIFGEADSFEDAPTTPLTLVRALEHIYNNGGRTVYAVRVANGTPAHAAFQTRNSADPPVELAQIEAISPGTWGNEIEIKILVSDEDALVREELNGDASSLNRDNILEDGALNQILMIQNSSGLTRTYEIVYNIDAGDIDNTRNQVSVNTTNGDLIFTELPSHAPTGADTIIASYQVPAANTRRVDISYKGTTERYFVADAAHLAEQIIANSALVTALEDDANNDQFYNQLPALTGDSVDDPPVRFGSDDTLGHTPGSNGENAEPTDYRAGLQELEEEIINIVVLAGQDAFNSGMRTELIGHINTTKEIRRERIGVIGSGTSDDADTLAGHVLNDDRIIFVGPGIKIGPKANLPGAYTAAAVAGLIASLPVQTSPTNKVLNIPGLSTRFNSSKLEKLVQKRVLAIEQREGFRIVKGITTSTNSAWHQITTRRIVDFAIYGVRSGSNPYIGKLNNERVRGALKATLDAFLTRMVENEALIGYELDVTATRAQQIAGEVIVTMIVKPVFSIDFIKVTMYLQ